MKRKQKVRVGAGLNLASNIKLRTALLFGTSFFILANAIVFIISFYINTGIPELAKALPAPANISGVINSYLRVTAVNNASRQFTADNISGNISDFQAGKTVMIYQAKGASITTNNTSSYGTVTAYNNSGNWEFAVISSITGSGPYTITVSSLVNNYSTGGAVQLVSVPEYTDAYVSGTITSVPWSSTQGRGGIVALQVANTLTLASNIDVTGQGFTGGQIGGSNGDCPDNTTYRSNSNDFGAKGEGISTDGRLYARAPQANAGGGGNPHNAGGGGGSNVTRGGYGGVGWQPGGGCSNEDAGGMPGNKFDYSSLSNKIFFGGGGGAGQQNNGMASAGASGGGIIVVRAKTVSSTCGGTYGFISNGNSAANAGANDGAGGGGGGGSIVLDVVTYNLACNLVVTANGGNGGSVNHADQHGGGGGGGIGIVLQSNLTSNSNVSIASSPGTNGVDCTSCTTPSGLPPETPTYYTMSTSGIPGQVITLPIELITFTGTALDEGVELLWKTASEENNDYFTLERSSNGLEFSPFEEIRGAGNSKEILTYSVVDKECYPNNTYYRLKQTDYDGKFSYSNVISVDTRSITSKAVIYPNPASNVVNVTNSEDGPLTVRLLNDRGVVVQSVTIHDPVASMDVTDLQEGVYFVEMLGSNKKVQKLVITR